MAQHLSGYCSKNSKWRRSVILILLSAVGMLLCCCASGGGGFILKTESIDCVDRAIAEMTVYRRHNPDAEIFAAVAKTGSRYGSQIHVEPVVKKGDKYYFFGFDRMFKQIEEVDMRWVFDKEPVLYPMDIFITAAQRHVPLNLTQLKIYNAAILSANGRTRKVISKQ